MFLPTEVSLNLFPVGRPAGVDILSSTIAANEANCPNCELVQYEIDRLCTAVGDIWNAFKKASFPTELTYNLLESTNVNSEAYELVVTSRTINYD